MSLDSFQDIFASLFHRGNRKRGGGRRPDQRHQAALDQSSDEEAGSRPLTDKTWMQPIAASSSQTRLTIVQITDVYTLDNFASLKTMLETIRQNRHGNPNDQVVSMLTGDFLAPYLLSSIDHGKGMMMAVNETPIDYLTWGNHEADIAHPEVMKRIKSYTGTLINSNMQTHESMKYDCSVPYEVIELKSADGKQTRRIGLIAVLSNDPKLYSHFKEPAFGGATIDDPWETLAHYKQVLQDEHGCDLVIPLEHMYVPENIKTCETFGADFPLILSGHDHHRIDQRINDTTRLIKPGMDGVFATVLEIVWDDDKQQQPKIRSTFVETSQFEPCPILKAKTDAAYDVLLPLRNTQLAGILPTFRPLTSQNARGSVCTMGKLICSMLKEALWQTHTKEEQEAAALALEEDSHGNQKVVSTTITTTKKIDAVILMGGNIRGNEDYPEDSFFSLETLEAEIKPDEVIGFVDMPGHILAAGIEATHAGDPIPGWFQYDDGVVEENGKITMVGGKPLEHHKVYRVATKIKDLTNGQSPPFKAYYEAHPELLPAKGQYINIHSELMHFFARGMFRKLWEATGELIPDPELVAEDATHPVNMDRLEGRLRLSVLDRDNDGYVTVDDIHVGLRDFLGLSVDDNYKTLAEQVHSCADATGNGMVTVEDFEVFCSGMPRELKLKPKWEGAFPDPLPEICGGSRSGTGSVNGGQHHHHFPLDGPFLKRYNTEPTYSSYAVDPTISSSTLPSDTEQMASVNSSDAALPSTALPPVEITFETTIA